MMTLCKNCFKRAAYAENEVLLAGFFLQKQAVSVAAEFSAAPPAADVGQRWIAAYATFHAIEKKRTSSPLRLWDPNTDVDDKLTKATTSISALSTSWPARPRSPLSSGA
jgi:hypothetical protein